MKKIYINIFLCFIILFSIYSAVLIGIGWDEGALIEIARLRLEYLLSFGFADYKALWFSHYYPGTYPVVVMFITQLFHKSYVVEIFHILNSFIGISAIFGISKIARELFNRNVGYIVFLISFFNPVFFGHMAMNSIDTIIAFANIWCFYEILRYLKYQQNKKRRNNYVIYCGLLLGLGLGVRYSFLITLIPIFLFLLIEIFYLKIFINSKFSKKIFLLDF